MVRKSILMIPIAVILFGLTLSSCKKCGKDEPKDVENRGTTSDSSSTSSGNTAEPNGSSVSGPKMTRVELLVETEKKEREAVRKVVEEAKTIYDRALHDARIAVEALETVYGAIDSHKLWLRALERMYNNRMSWILNVRDEYNGKDKTLVNDEHKNAANKVRENIATHYNAYDMGRGGDIASCSSTSECNCSFCSSSRNNNNNSSSSSSSDSSGESIFYEKWRSVIDALPGADMTWDKLVEVVDVHRATLKSLEDMKPK